MKSNHSTKLIVLIPALMLFLFSCRKSAMDIPQNLSAPAYPEQQADSDDRPTTAMAAIVTPQVYSGCGSQFIVFQPNPYLLKTYSLSVQFPIGKRKIRISNGKVYTDNPDEFTFEQAGYANAQNTIKTWRIRKTNGQYLTAVNGRFSYTNKITAVPAENNQIFLLSNPDNGLVKITLPRVKTCQRMSISYPIDGPTYVANSYDYNSNQLQFSSPIYLVSETLPLGTK